MKRLLVLALAASVAATSLVAMAQQTPQPGAAAQPTANRGRKVDGVMATVNDQVISQSDVRNRMRWMLLRFEQPQRMRRSCSNSRIRPLKA